jgi:hypothetical protein
MLGDRVRFAPLICTVASPPRLLAMAKRLFRATSSGGVSAPPINPGKSNGVLLWAFPVLKRYCGGDRGGGRLCSNGFASALRLLPQPRSQLS